MKNIKTIAFALCMSFLTSVALAESRMGVSAAYMMFSTSGSETLRDTSKLTNGTHDDEVLVPSLFIEVMSDTGLGVGVDYVPVAEIGSKSGADDDIETTGANKASAELASHVTLYAIAEGSNGFYGKLGVAFADVDTTETLATGDAYGNADTHGYMIAIGKNFQSSCDYFVRGDLSYTTYDEISITSTGGSTVKADFDSMAATISVGKSF